MTLGSSDFVQYLETTKEVFPPAPSSGLLYMTSGGTAQDFLKEQNALFFRLNTSIAGVKELLEKQEGCSNRCLYKRPPETQFLAWVPMCTASPAAARTRNWRGSF